MAEEGWLGRIRSAVAGKRVIPPEPPGKHSAGPAADAELPAKEGRDDHSASWSTFITYTDRHGEESSRVISIRKISGKFGKPELIGAHCHLRGAYREFKVANITGMICTNTGEELDPLENCLALHRHGALKIEDVVLTRMMRLLVFMARCDGEFHKLERTTLDEVLGRYFRFFGGDDAGYECAVKEAPRLAPDGQQFGRDLGWLARMSPRDMRPQLARFAIDSCGAMIDADGMQAAEEVYWGVEVGNALKRIAGRG
jgi:hypothetical protein